MPPWRSVMTAASAMALVAGLIAARVVKAGPFVGPRAPFNWKFALHALRYPPTRLANFGYLGHMWEPASASSPWAPLAACSLA
jgi:hypothetical protein